MDQTRSRAWRAGWNGLLGILVAGVLGLFAAPASAGTIVADSGFRPNPDGFSFQNYGDEEGYADLNATEMQRLFGRSVCVSRKGGRCVLTPGNREWMKSMNEAMAGGHCYGFAMLSETIEKGELPRFGYESLSAFGPGDNTFALGIEDNTVLQRAIARAWTTQLLESVQRKSVNGTPKDALDALLNGALDPNSRESWTALIFQPGFEAGHAITPYAVEDMGGGIYDVHVYDNNWPDDSTRRMRIDANANTWSYYASTQPNVPGALYEGDASTQTLILKPSSPGYGIQECPQCVGRQGASSKYNQLTLDGSGTEHAHLLITDRKGRRTGFVGDEFVNEIPGVKVMPRSSGGPEVAPDGSYSYADSLEPLYKVPRKRKFKLKIDGSTLTERDRQSLTLVGPTYDATVERIALDPGEVAHLRLSPRAERLTYKRAPATKSPTVTFGAQSKRAAFRISVSAPRASKNATLFFKKRPEQGLLRIGDSAKKRQVLKIAISRYDGSGQSQMKRRFSVGPRERAFLYYGALARPRGAARVVVVGPGGKRVKVLKIKRVKPKG